MTTGERWQGTSNTHVQTLERKVTNDKKKNQTAFWSQRKRCSFQIYKEKTTTRTAWVHHSLWGWPPRSSTLLFLHKQENHKVQHLLLLMVPFWRGGDWFLLQIFHYSLGFFLAAVLCHVALLLFSFSKIALYCFLDWSSSDWFCLRMRLSGYKTWRKGIFSISNYV